MRFRDMTLRLVRSASVFSCVWLGVLTAAAQQRVAQPVGGQMQASSPDANRANKQARDKAWKRWNRLLKGI